MLTLKKIKLNRKQKKNSKLHKQVFSHHYNNKLFLIIAKKLKIIVKNQRLKSKIYPITNKL